MEINIKDYQIKTKSMTAIINNDKTTLTFIDNNMSYIKEDIDNYYQNTIQDILLDEIKRRNLSIKDPNKKIIDSLKIVNLDKSILERNINNISTTEKKLLQLSIALLSNPEIIILDNYFKNIDIKLEKKIIMLFQKIKDKYNKTIILINDNLDKIYKYTEYYIIIKDNAILLEGNFKKLVDKIKLLKENNIDIPDILEFTYLAKTNKKIKLDYYKDIRDLIKDIYKHV